MRFRDAVVRRIEAWWSAFAKDARRIDAHFSEGKPFDVPKFVERNLERINERLMWEFGPPLEKGRHRLVITLEGDPSLRPLLDQVLARAPRNTGFEFYPYRPAVSLEVATSMVRGRTGATLDGWSVHIAPTEDFGVDLAFKSPPSAVNSEQARYVGIVAAECLLGGEVFDTWVDAIDVEAEVKGKTVPLARLAKEVEATLKRLRAKLPAKGIVKSRTARNGAVYEVEPNQQEDYPRQKDIFVGATTNLPVAQRALSDRTFASQRFSRTGETFCYLKIDGINGLDPRGFEDRGDIEDALDAALLKPKLGITFGGAPGLRYSYVELALRDVERSVPIIKKVLRTGHIPKRTWLLFHDSSLQAEWVGLWDDTPAPP